MKRIIVCLLITVTALSILTACGQQENTAPVSTGETSVEDSNTQQDDRPAKDQSGTKAVTDITIESLESLPLTPEADFETSPLEEDTVTLGSYTGSEVVAAVPDTIDGKRVVSVMGYSYANSSPLIGIRLPDSVTEMDEMVFTNAEALKYAIIGNNLKELPNATFLNCPKLEEVRLNEGLTSIGEMCFSNCVSLKTLYIPESVTSIGDGAFYAVGEGFVIEGKAGSFAEIYANENGISFSAK